MDLSGIIFVVLALAWAVYLIPKAIKHHDELARTRSVDRFSNAMRVLARREPVGASDARLVVTSSRQSTAAHHTDPGRPSVPEDPAAPRPRRTSGVRGQAAARRAAARAAARRRRRVTLVLLVSLLATAALAGFVLVPWWSVAIPATLLVLYLGLCRRQVRRQNDALWGDRPQVRDGDDVAPRRAVRVDSAYGSVHVPRDGQEFSPDEDTVALPVAAMRSAVGGHTGTDEAAVHAGDTEAVAVSVPTVDGGSLWDPLPVTLPTYVNKQRAARTVRTIDLSEPGTWTSGRTAEDTRLVEETDTAQKEPEITPDEQRAVGS